MSLRASLAFGGIGVHTIAAYALKAALGEAAADARVNELGGKIDFWLRA
jgi:hypothetical protein